MIFTYLAQYLRETYKYMADYYKKHPEPEFKKPDAYKNINSHVCIKI